MATPVIIVSPINSMACLEVNCVLSSISILGEIILLKKRNKKVETDKAWGVSTTRKLLIIVFTYFTIGLFMVFIKVNNPWINAIVPSLGFLLSTLSMPFFKKY